MKIHSAIAYVNEHVPAAGKEIHYTACGAIEGNQYIRKAHSMFGWDWGPQLPDMGIWRDIFIDSYEKAELSDLHIRQEHIDGKVFLSAETKVMLPEKAQDGEIAEAEYLVLPQSAESNARILKESVGSDDFDTGRLSLNWQWNHNPLDDCWSLTERPGFLRLRTGRVVDNLFLAPNTLTQRMSGPKCSGVVAMDVSKMKEGDVTSPTAFSRSP